MEAIILAGGLGTRLRSAVPDVPKAMAAVGERPFLAIVLDRLVEAGFKSAVLAVGYRHEVIRSHFGEHYRSLALRYSVESAPLGTGGAISLAWKLATMPDPFVLNGDTYLELDFRRMLDAHLSAQAALSMAVCFVPDAARYGALELAEGRVRGFREKGQPGAGWINAGAYVLGAELRDHLPRNEAFSFEHDVLARKAEAIRPLAFPCDGLFIDVGVPEDYARAQALLR